MMELFIEENQERRIALKEQGKLTEFYIEEKQQGVRSGDLFLGVIKKKVKALNAVFIDLGLAKHGFLYLAKDAIFQDYIEGQSILVEILKEEEGSKGAKVTDRISLGGKYVVLFPGKGLRYSKKIQKERFLEKHGDQKPVEGFKILYREASLEATTNEVLSEREELVEKFQKVLKKAETGVGPKKLYGENSILDRIMRDKFHAIQMIYVDSAKVEDDLKEEYGLPSLRFQGETSLFDFYGIDQELESLNYKRVPLSLGGNLIIEQTEAMVVIDVNSAKHTKMKNKNETAIEVNLIAAEEIARQVKLRNLAGIIVIDFIDMENETDHKKLQDKVQESFKDDPLFSKAYPLTELNLMQITRKKKGHPLAYYLKESCFTCHGEGQILSFAYLKKKLKNEFLKRQSHGEINAYHVKISQAYENSVMEDLTGFLQDIHAKDKEIFLEFSQHEKKGYEISPLVFKSQIEEVSQFRVKL